MAAQHAPPPPTTTTTTTKVVGDYELLSKLGCGSYASVYRSVNLKTGESYAIKAISKEKVGDPKLMENLDQEIAIMRDYLHGNIVRLFEHFSSTRYIYLVLELCPGGDLSKFIKKRGRIDEPVAHVFLKQITDGLKFLQSKHVIHRDLKPANILLSEASDHATLKIADFGFAKQLAEVASMAQTPCGSPLYMAPEIFEMQEYDAKADVWSVGCIFYEMLVGTPPFKGSNPRDLFQNIRTKQLQVPADVVVGSDSLSILRKLLERTPQRRASLDQLFEACRVITSPERLAASAAAVAAGPARAADSGTAPTPALAPAGSAAEGKTTDRFADFDSQRLISRRHSLGSGITGPAESAASAAAGAAAALPLRVSGGGAGMVRGRAASTAYPPSYAPYANPSSKPSSPPQHPHHQQQQQQQQPPQSSMASSILGMGISRAIAFMVSPTKPAPSSSQPSAASAPATPTGHTGQRPPLSDPRPGASAVSPHQQHQQRPRTSSEGAYDAARALSYESAAAHTSARAQQQQQRAHAGTVVEKHLGGSDDGFVIVDSTAAAPHPWRAHDPSTLPPPPAVVSASPPTRYSPVPPPAPSSSSSSSRQQAPPSPTAVAAPAPAPERPASSPEHPYQIHLPPPSTAAGDADKAMVTSVVQRCEYVSHVLLAIVALGDSMVRDASAQERKAAAARARTHHAAGGAGQVKVMSQRPRGESTDGPMPSFAGACAVYLHCLALLRDCIQRTGAVGRALAQPFPPPGGPVSADMVTLSRVQAGLLTLFDQVLARVEQCHKRLTAAHAAAAAAAASASAQAARGRSASNASSNSVAGYAPSDGTSVASASPAAYSPTWLLHGPLAGHAGPAGAGPASASVCGRITAEPLMYRAAWQLARDAGVDELLGNLLKASEDYTSARLLLEGVMMTATEAADRASLHGMAQACGDHAAHCRALLESHSQILPLASSPAAAGGALLMPGPASSQAGAPAAMLMLRQSAVGLGAGGKSAHSPRVP